MRFESAQTVIDAIIASLKKGREQLEPRQRHPGRRPEGDARADAQAGAPDFAGRAAGPEARGQAQRELAGDEAKRKFLEEELLFPLRQRIMDLQQQLAVNQQGVLAVTLIVATTRS